MSEKLKNHESGEHSAENYGEHSERLQEQIEAAAEKSRHEHQESLEDIQKKIEQEAISTHELTPGEIESNQPAHNGHYTNSYVRGHSFKQTMKKVQKQLPARERTFSKVIHNSVVETTSDIAGATIARPSGLLFGGIFSVFGSVAVLIICRYYGYEYNYLIGLGFFVGGFFLGLLIELASHTIRAAR